MHSAFVISALVFATGALAQSNPYIPTSDISAGCTTFLQTLNTDSSLATCTSSILSATKAFSQANSTSSISTVLSNLCEDTTSCVNSVTRGLLTQFFTACTPEIDGENPNEAVAQLYDVLYTFTPYRAALCAKDSTTGAFCASGLSGVTPAARKRDAPQVNPAQMRAAGTQYLFLTPSDAADTLCKPCTKSIMQAYVTWEYLLPYGPGLLQSPILGGQSDLWSAIGTKCGAGFLSTITADSNAAPLAALASGASSMARVPAFVGTLLVGLGAVILM